MAWAGKKREALEPGSQATESGASAAPQVDTPIVPPVDGPLKRVGRLKRLFMKADGRFPDPPHPLTLAAALRWAVGHRERRSGGRLQSLDVAAGASGQRDFDDGGTESVRGHPQRLGQA